MAKVSIEYKMRFPLGIQRYIKLENNEKLENNGQQACATKQNTVDAPSPHSDGKG
ncbi:MAG: hypothetical protein P8176_12775 [Gammaproteobacteria bacterium]